MLERMVERFCKGILGSPLPMIVEAGSGSPENWIGKVGGFMGIESRVRAKRGAGSCEKRSEEGDGLNWMGGGFDLNVGVGDTLDLIKGRGNGLQMTWFWWNVYR